MYYFRCVCLSGTVNQDILLIKMFCFIHLIICLLSKPLYLHLCIFINNSHTFIHYTHTHIAYNFNHKFYNILPYTTIKRITLCKKDLKMTFPSLKLLILLPFNCCIYLIDNICVYNIKSLHPNQLLHPSTTLTNNG